MVRHRLAVATLCAALALTAGAVVAAVESVSGPASVETAAERLDSQARALLVSDSAWLGLKTYGAVDSVQGFEHTLDLASCRRRVVPSCRNYDGHVPITLADEVVLRSGAYDTLIVATGYNDSDHNFLDDVATVMALARERHYRRVVWLTLRSNVTYTSPDDAGFAAVFGNNNVALAELVAADTYPELVIADWAAYARDQSDWFASDGIHLRRAGPWAAGDYISRKLAFLDDRPCPQPVTAGASPQAPCPDPDVTGVVVDIGAVYPVGATCAIEPFAMEWAGRSSWPEPPCWAG